MLRPNLCDYIDAYIVVKGDITVTDPNNNAYDKKLMLTYPLNFEIRGYYQNGTRFNGVYSRDNLPNKKIMGHM